MRQFMDEDFLLKTETARRLYHEAAELMPVYDYHCHLSAKEIAENKQYKNLTEIWLYGDHYKWRAMRSNGVDESCVTGEASDKEKYMAWAETIPNAIGNPLYHWTHLELKRYFDISEPLTIASAERIWEICNAKLATDEFRAKRLIERSNVTVICTTDDPTDQLEDHVKIAEDKDFKVKVLPTFRPDKAYNIEAATFLPWIKVLGDRVGFSIDSVEALLKALSIRVDYFHDKGCRLSDHGLEIVYYKSASLEEVEEIFKKAIDGKTLTSDDLDKFKGYVQYFLGTCYAKKGWVMQLHIGALRNNNRRMFESVGADIGFDSVADTIFAEKLSAFMGDLDYAEMLPKTILYALNSRDYDVLGTMIGNFQGGGIAGKIQFGSAWWFCDHKSGMEKQIDSLASLGLLSRFVGMLTDSRSFLSYTRHEYFRRILCNIIGEWVENGEYPFDWEQLNKIIRDISYDNAVDYFGIEI